MKRFWRRNKRTIINGAIILVMVGAIALFERISIGKPVEESFNPETTNTPVTEQEEPVKEEEKPSLPLTISAATLSDGEVLTLGENCIKKNKEFTFQANVEEMGTLIFRHGERTYGASWISLDDKNIEVYAYSDHAARQYNEEHGLTIAGPLSVHVKIKANEVLSLKITAGGKNYVLDDITWMGCKGSIEVESMGNELTDVEVTWDSEDIRKDIWVLGDSYLGSRWKNRWPYYVIEAGYDTALYTGYPAANSHAMYKEWERLLEYDTPKYAVWCLGMFDGDGISSINMTWKAKLQLFLADCERLGITPILATIPNTPLVNNTYKNEYIRNSGHRYIDFAMAVGANKKTSVWLEEMLSTDEVHPTSIGAEALAEQILEDFPEIKGEKK